ncbi:MAG: DUF3040 domain-containing protein [Calditrichaceae bacterium]|jgi:hypothetical protein
MINKLTPKGNSNDRNWAPAKPEKLPRLTFWPIVLAAGVVFLFWGFITSIIISIVGFVVMALALYGWIGEFSDE